MELIKYTQRSQHGVLFQREIGLTLVHYPQLHPFALQGQPQGRYKIFKKILTPSKITLPLHRFIKKFLKIFQAHENYIASLPTPPPHPPPPPPTNSHSVPSKWTSKRIVPQRRLVATQRKMRDHLHDCVQ